MNIPDFKNDLDPAALSCFHHDNIKGIKLSQGNHADFMTCIYSRLLPSNHLIFHVLRAHYVLLLNKAYRNRNQREEIRAQIIPIVTQLWKLL